MKKYNIIDLFAGCGGLLEGFLHEGSYFPIASAEWEKAPLETLKHRLKTRWDMQNADEKCLLMDIQQDEKLFKGWKNDEEYGDGVGLDYLVDKYGTPDVIIGGPPCQAYSVAGRIRDENQMKDDYRNYLFENYLKVVNKYRPKAFVFENVPGMLSAKPGGVPVTDLIRKEIESIGYEIVDDLKKYAILDSSDFGVPQARKRVIIIGLDKNVYKDPQVTLKDFYTNIITKYKVEKKITLWDAIGDLPKAYPTEEYRANKARFSHTIPETDLTNHIPRYHNKGDIDIFRTLAEDIESGNMEHTSSAALNELYYQKTGKRTNVHKYHVLRKDQPSTTIIAHLNKDGLRFIHPDPEQARSITVREAARLQTFDDDYEFICSQGANYKMIGNAVPPLLAKCISSALKEIL